jgi:hypothetical protein
VPGILETADVGDIVAALAVRPVCWRAWWMDATAAHRTGSQAPFETAAAAYGTARSQLVVRDRGTPSRNRNLDR